MRYSDYTGVILAGGRGSRIGSDKSGLELKGRKLIDRSSELMMDLFGRCLIVVGHEKSPVFGFLPCDADIAIDDFKGKGPVGGLYTALSRILTPYMFIMACDMPFPSRRLIERMTYISGEHDAVVPISRGYPEPLFAIYSRKSRIVFEQSLMSGRLKIQDSLDMLNTKYLKESEYSDIEDSRKSFLNVNTKEDAKSMKIINGLSVSEMSGTTIIKE